jgi:hypothetical protein
MSVFSVLRRMLVGKALSNPNLNSIIQYVLSWYSAPHVSSYGRGVGKPEAYAKTLIIGG